MPIHQTSLFTTIRSEGGLLPADFLQKLAEGNKDIPGLKSTDYHLFPEERLNEVINRSWTRLLGAWESFRNFRDKLPEGDYGTTITRERWLLPLFQELGYGRLQVARAYEILGKTYPISHIWKNCPIHLIGFRVDLDTRTAGAAGAARTSPHSLMQEFLNRSDDHLWAFVSNGLSLRIVRDNVSLTRQAYVEFDLEAMMDGEIYSDFALLWLLCHQSRIEADKPEECWLEQWCNFVQETGTRALETLRGGVEQAISKLGTGFLSHTANGDLREKLFSGTLDKQDYYRQLLRLVYRLLFLFVAEDRNLLLSPKVDKKTSERYLRFYSTSRLRHLAEIRRGSKHPDLWRMLTFIFSILGGKKQCTELGLSPLGSFLWSSASIVDLTGCDITNADLLDAVRELAFTMDGRIRRPVDYKNLGSEELGSIYESLLELHPDLNTDARTFELITAAGHERKTTGSYYTPTSLITCLLDSALDPVLDEASKAKDPKMAILDLKVCDPACGSGHFLVAAAHRMAKRLASVRTGDNEPSPEAVRQALRDVIGRCIYGVDLNPMSVELCKVSLWMESLEPGKPLAFLDHHIRLGNSLLGTTPELLTEGIPDDTFKPIEGDDPAFCKRYKAFNKQERKTKQMTLFSHDYEKWENLNDLAIDIDKIESIDDCNIDGITEKQRYYEKILGSEGYEDNRFISDVWCSAFVLKKAKSDKIPYPITEEVFLNIKSNPRSAPAWLKVEVQRLATQYQFFHWFLSFPEVFSKGGFDCVIGNPPWEKMQLEEKQFFASTLPQLAEAPAKERKKLIEQLRTLDPHNYQLYVQALHKMAGQVHIVKDSGRFPFSGGGNVSTHTLFIELALTLTNMSGLFGLIVPSGIATQESQSILFRHMVKDGKLRCLYDFENKAGLFAGVHRQYRFCLVVAGRAQPQKGANYAFFLHSTSDLADQNRIFSLSYDELIRFSPNTLSCPTFISLKDAQIVRQIYEEGSILLKESDDSSPWGWRSWQMFNETHEAALMHMATDEDNATEWDLLYEAKLIHQFDHRYASYCSRITGSDANTLTVSDKNNPNKKVETRYVVAPDIWRIRLAEKGYDKLWVLAYRQITNATNERTSIFTILPKCSATSTLPIVITNVTASLVACLTANLNSFVFDYVSRTRVAGTHLNHFILHQLPVIPPCVYQDNLAINEYIQKASLELIYTSWDLEPFAKDCGWSSPPFQWDDERRFLLRCELDATFFHLYLKGEQNGEWSKVEGKANEELAALTVCVPTPRDAVYYIMDTFPIVKRRDEEKFGEYRTKRIILEIYDAMSEAKKIGQNYQTRLDPPPADLRCCHKPREK